MALVPRAASGPIRRLLERVHRQHPEADRQRVLHGHVAQAPGGLTRDVVEVRRFSPDDSAERDQTGIAAGLRGAAAAAAGARTLRAARRRLPARVEARLPDSRRAHPREAWW